MISAREGWTLVEKKVIGPTLVIGIGYLGYLGNWVIGNMYSFIIRIWYGAASSRSGQQLSRVGNSSPKPWLHQHLIPGRKDCLMVRFSEPSV